MQEERQRSHILASKAEKEGMILDKAANIQRMRKAAAAQAHVRRAKTAEELKASAHKVCVYVM